jgi:SAM-dependent methyltransferase
MDKFKNKIPKGFIEPTSLPRSFEEKLKWQEANYSWWESNPMGYDWKEEIPYKKFTREFYLEIDRRFFSNSWEYLPWGKTPFDSLIDFQSLKNKDVFEIGVGNGSHAQLLARYSRSFTGIDLTDYATQSTAKRMELFGLKARILKMDAEKLGFNDNSFDFVWSWGVIHHSSNTEQILKEIQRVLRPGGKAVIMVYYRGWWNYYIKGFFQGFITGDLLKTGSLHQSVQLQTDGALARYYTLSEWKLLVEKWFVVKSIEIFGPKSDIVLLPGGALKKILTKIIPNPINRFLTHQARMGSFLVSLLEKHR